MKTNRCFSQQKHWDVITGDYRHITFIKFMYGPPPQKSQKNFLPEPKNMRNGFNKISLWNFPAAFGDGIFNEIYVAPVQHWQLCKASQSNYKTFFVLTAFPILVVFSFFVSVDTIPVCFHFKFISSINRLLIVAWLFRLFYYFLMNETKLFEFYYKA